MATALLDLYEGVTALFAAEGRDVPMSFGWLASSEQMAGDHRIVWIPGDDGDGLGAIGAPKYPGGNPRRIANVDELARVEITGSSAEDEESAQYDAARGLFDAWLLAMHRKAHGRYRLVSAKWVGGDRARRMGATLRVTFAVQSPVLDQIVPAAPVDTSAVLDVAELDHTEQLEVEKAP